MYACVYFQKDGTLSIVHENDKDIKVLTTFEKREPVEMKWRKPGKQAEVFNGVIVSVGDKEDDLVKLATEASHKIKLEPGQQAPQELFNFQIPSIKAKRMQKKSRRMEESLNQEEELSPKKKKKSTSESTPAIQEKKKKTKPEPAKKDVHVTESVSELANKQSKCQSKTQIEISKSMVKLCGQFQNDNNAIQEPVMGDQTQKEPSQPKPVSRSPEKQHNVTVHVPLTDTWKECKGALGLMMDDTCHSPNHSTIQQSCSISVSSEFIKTLPTVINFLTKLSDHLKPDPDNNCQHTCFQLIPSNHEPSFTEDLYDMDNMGLAAESSTTYNEEFLGNYSAGTSADFMQGDGSYVHSTPKTALSSARTLSPSDSLATFDDSEHEEFPRPLPPLPPYNKDYRAAASASTLTETTTPTMAKSTRTPTETTPTKSTPTKKSRTRTPNKRTPTKTTPTKTSRTPNKTRTPTPKKTRTPPKTTSTKSTKTRTPNKTPTKTARELAMPLPRALQERTSVSTSKDQVQLIPSSTITVDRVQLSNRCQAVKDKGAVKAAYSLTYKLLDLVFTLHELAKSRGTGAGKGDPTKPVLNIERVSVLKKYVHGWCRKNFDKSYSEKELNTAITERSHYARTQLKNMMMKKQKKL